MIRRTIGLIDYGAGNLSSVRQTVLRIGHRCRIGQTPEALSDTDMLLLPGVGAFPAAMKRLQESGLDEYIVHEVRAGKPLLGLCLGMQLLADSSAEFGHTAGLGLIPGEVRHLEQARWHIGWNTISATTGDPLIKPSDGLHFYFNHSFAFYTDAEHALCTSQIKAPFTAGVRKGKVAGFQFHPEKSQDAGRQLLSNTIMELCRD